MASRLNIKATLQRWRHGMGFGVHSPFAFRFITEVLNLPKIYGYYAYLYIADERMRTLFRVINRLRPNKISIPEKNKEIRAAVNSAVPHATIVPMAEADMVILDGRKQRKLAVDEIPDGASLVVLNFSRWKNWQMYKAAMPAGMTFANRKEMAIAIPFSHLPRQDFDVKFK